MSVKVSACVVALVVWVGVASAEKPVSMGQVFELDVGQSVSVGHEGLRVGFTGTESDGRCAIGLYCFWEGDAATKVWAEQPGEDRADLVLHTSSMFNRDAVYASYRITLLALDPYPVYEVPTDPDDYVVTLKVEKVTSTITPVEHTTWGKIKALYTQ
jgi:hypothetical protein